MDLMRVSEGICKEDNLYYDFAGEFLDRGEKNYNKLSKKTDWLFEELESTTTTRSGRRDIDHNFLYGEQLKKSKLSKYIRSFEDASRLSLEAFEGCIKWHDPNALFNITPPPLLDTVALSTITTLYNPNAIWDITSGKFILKEKQVIKYLSELVDWNSDNSGGLFTYGGKGTLIYAIKSGINRCDRESVKRGLNNNYVVIANELSHFSVESAVNYMGIGHENCTRIKTDSNGFMDLNILKEKLEGEIKKGKKIACIILNGGGTMNLTIDPIKAVSNIIDETVEKFNLDYRPYLHVDTVISWAWMFFKYDYKDYDYNMDTNIANKILTVSNSIQELKYADSFGADFHKTGLTPYNSSCFVCKDNAELISLNSPELKTTSTFIYGDEMASENTLENSRACTGIISAYHVIERLGVEGFQKYLAFRMRVSERFREVMNDNFKHLFEIVNTKTLGYEIVFKINFFNDQRSLSEISKSSIKERNIYKNICDEFCEYITYGDYCNSKDIPFIGYVAKYKYLNEIVDCPAFLLYPMAVDIDEYDINEILEKISEIVHIFEREKRLGILTSERTLRGIKEPPK